LNVLVLSSWVAFFFFNRDTVFNATEFGAFMTLILGGTIITVFSFFLTTQNQWVYWIYPMGLVVGMFAYAIVARITGHGEVTIFIKRLKH